ncbi:sensor histidine kinase [Fibrella aquatilis]|uniref:Histidine kinase n=1 Tax=Fibrella aquatilis TaxID=2817059 RepID=A0A939JVZ6_9BACT|nr:histidine kinase [Fibrella aquatilis]MBO0931372.1 histidine kinase [Fibrella aquatilis]
MNKATSFLFLLLLTTQTAHAQFDWGKYSHSFPDGTTDNPSVVGIIAAVPKPNDSYWDMKASTDKLAQLAGDSLFRGFPLADIVARTTFDTARVHFFLHGVTPKNAAEYQFRVKEYPGQTVLVPWGSPHRFTESNRRDWPQMAYLGGFTAPLGHMISVEARQTGNQQLVGASLIAWVPISPAISSLYTSNNLDAFLKKLQYPWAKETDAGTGSLSGRVDKPSDPLTLPATNRNLIFYLTDAEIYSKEQVQYELIWDGQVIRPWQSNEYDNSFIWLKDYTPGSYRLNIRYTVQPQHVTSYYFAVQPAWYQSLWFRSMVGLFITACLGAGAFGVLFVRQKQKNREAVANKTKLQLELKAIYAQLNPHFVFNALSSIQGLINTGDIQGANTYLADFARLMRESLANSNKEELSLDKELQGLDTYLKLEQLRFGFRYQLTLDEAINQFDTSLPALLLQPLVENAVKHGVSALREVGLITVRFDKTGEAMTICITDNGRGFDASQPTGGFGLKLTHDRIKLLNELNSEQPIQLTINQLVTNGTEVLLRFNNWFA